MFLIAGLGNPGKKYQSTGHNIGFEAIEGIIEKFKLSELNFESDFLAHVSKEKIGEKTVILVKPETFMNLSGKSIAKIARFYKIKPENIIIIHDDVDLSLGQIKIVKNRGSAGHKGINSIIKELATKDFIRVRIGLRPEEKPTNWQTEKFVLKKMTKEAKEKTKESIGKTVEIIKICIEKGYSRAQNIHNS